MNLEIKYRVWDVELKIWFDPIYDSYRGELYDIFLSQKGDLLLRTHEGIIHESLFSNKFKKSLFTGLKDKNERDIFEGDIILITYREGIEEKMVVRYKDEKALFCLIDENGNKWGFDKSNNLKVIGNIYEHPNLLENN